MKEDAVEKIKYVVSHSHDGRTLTELADEIYDTLFPPSSGDDSLTIVANQGVHAIDESKLPGEVFYASHGNLGGSPMTAEDLQADLVAALSVAATKLKERHYQTVYIVPSGLPVLSLNLALVVHQVTSKPAVILQYDREGGDYWPIQLDIRQIVVDAK